MWKWWTLVFAMTAVLHLPVTACAQLHDNEMQLLDTVIKGGTEFAIKLLRNAGKPDENAFVSPHSVAEALAMAATGAKGDTRGEMLETLGLPDNNVAVNKAFRVMRKRLMPASTAPVELSIANRLWGQSGVSFHAEFLKTLQRDYGAALGQVDFRADAGAARERINSWIEEQTKGRIKDLLPDGALSDQTRLVLTNAIYFKAPWQKKFDADDTTDEDFTLANGDKVKVPMMQQNASLRHLRAEGYQALELLYEGATLSMLIFLPDKPDGLASLEKDLDTKVLEYFEERARRVPVHVYLPRFTMTRSLSLASALRTMGMRLAFSQTADFSGMADEESLQISDVIHKAFVEVTEEGTEAAAATAVVMGITAARIEDQKPVVFRADRPFLFLIRDTATRSVLFIGRLADPR